MSSGLIVCFLGAVQTNLEIVKSNGNKFADSVWFEKVSIGRHVALETASTRAASFTRKPIYL